MLYLIKSSYVDENENFCYILKVGYTENIEGLKIRLKDYGTHNPSVKLLGTFEQGTQKHEAIFHNIFRDKRLKIKGSREWFIFDQSIIDFFSTMTVDSLKALYNPLDNRAKRKFIYEEILDKVVKEELKDLVIEYFKLSNITSQVKYICEIEEEVVLNDFLDLLPPDEYAKQYYLLLGKEKCEELHYSTTAIRNFFKDLEYGADILKPRILEEFKVGTRLTRKDIKSTLAKIYEELQFSGSPKANDLKQWFEIRETFMTVDGKRVHGFEIVSKK